MNKILTLITIILLCSCAERSTHQVSDPVGQQSLVSQYQSDLFDSLNTDVEFHVESSLTDVTTLYALTPGELSSLESQSIKYRHQVISMIKDGKIDTTEELITYKGFVTGDIYQIASGSPMLVILDVVFRDLETSFLSLDTSCVYEGYGSYSVSSFGCVL